MRINAQYFVQCSINPLSILSISFSQVFVLGDRGCSLGGQSGEELADVHCGSVLSHCDPLRGGNAYFSTVIGGSPCGATVV